MKSYKETERFQRKAGQDDFSFRETGERSVEQPETGWSLVDQVAAGSAGQQQREAAASQPDPGYHEPQPTTSVDPALGTTETQDATLDRFATLLKTHHRREMEEADSDGSASEQPLKPLLRRIAAAEESRIAQC